MLPPYIQAVISVLSGLVSLIAVVNLVHSRRQEHAEAKERRKTEALRRERERAEDEAWRKSVEDSLRDLKQTSEKQERRIDSHNGYAKMFAENTKDTTELREDLAEMRESLAYIKGRIEKLSA